MVRTLVAGPWIGEFGWELFCWQGFLRQQAPQYDRVVVVCREGHDLLYHDFATDIVHYTPLENETDMWKNHRDQHAERFITQYCEERLSQCAITRIRNDAFRSRWWDQEHWSQRQRFVAFDNEELREMGPWYDVAIIVRNTRKCQTGFRNWPVDHATEFVNALRERKMRVACIGTHDAAAAIPGASDCRGFALHSVANVLSRTRVIVGPQSGPIHFGSLCKTPQVCWQTCPEHAKRAEVSWNPFSVPVVTIPATVGYWKQRRMWLPSVDHLVNKTVTHISTCTEN